LYREAFNEQKRVFIKLYNLFTSIFTCVRLGAVEVESKRNNFSENIACINNIHEIDSLLAAENN